MPIQFTTDGSPGYRRLALWQDIVCDVFVGLDCKSDLGSAFRGSVTQATLGKADCSEVCSRPPARLSHAVAHRALGSGFYPDRARQSRRSAAWCRTAARP